MLRTILKKSYSQFFLACLFTIACLFPPQTAHAQLELVKLHDLQGMVDSAGTTHLFYRMYEEGEESSKGRVEHNDHVYHFEVESEVDTLFYEDFLEINSNLPNESHSIADFAFRFGDLNYKVKSQVGCYTECASSTYVHTNDTTWGWGYSPAGFWAGAGFTMDPYNQAVVYQATPSSRDNDSTRQLTGPNGQILAGFNAPDSTLFSYSLRSISPHDRDVRFGLDDNNVVRIAGETRTVIVDTTLGSRGKYEFFYSGNPDMVFLKVRGAQEGRTGIYRSTDAGKAGSWTVMNQDSSFMALEADTSMERIYASRRDTLLVSEDDGKSFQVETTFENRITGIYKPGSKKELYVSTISDILKRNGDGAFTTIKQVDVGIEDKKDGELPSKITLEPNYPNPFNPSTNIRFNLPEASDVQLTVYNTIGRKVSTLIHQKMTAGSHSITFDASGMPSGVYIYRLKADGFSQSRKMLLLK